MKKVVLLSLVLVIVMGFVGAVAAQDMPGPGEGGAIVWGNQRGSANIDPLISLRCSGVDCSDINALLYPGLIGISPVTQNYAPAGADYMNYNSLATGWELSEDGMKLTVNLRDGLVWNDGTPITALDFYFFWAALKNVDPTETSSSFSDARTIAGINVIDDYTMEILYDVPSCKYIDIAANLVAMPAQYFGFTLEGEADFDWTSLIGSEFDDAPPISGGPFQFSRTEPGTAIYLEANLTYADPVYDYVIPMGLVYLDVPDYNIMAERLIANQSGDVNYMNEPDAAVLPTLLEAQDNGMAQVFSAPGRLWHYVSLNLADPTNPQNGWDDANGNFQWDEGEEIFDQGHHPILGDKRVRQALQHAVNIQAIIDGPLNGNGSPMSTQFIPTAWTLNPDIPIRPYDLDAARALLDEAGWIATGDPLVDGGDGLRTCQGCLYAEEGTEFIISNVNPGDVRNDDAVLLQATFAEIGVQLNVQPVDFNAMYDDHLGAQIYDTAVAGWRGAFPFDSDTRWHLGFESDVYGTESSGFNFGSWYNAEYEELSEFIANGSCDTDEILAAAYRIQEIVYDEQPYLFLYAFNSSYIVNASVEGFDPYPNFGGWNMDAWNVKQ